MADATPQGTAGPDPEELAGAPILRLTPFVEQMGTPTGIRKEFWWEREWRHVGDLHFAPADLVVVFAPQAEHDWLRERLAQSPHYPAVDSRSSGQPQSDSPVAFADASRCARFRAVSA